MPELKHFSTHVDDVSFERYVISLVALQDENNHTMSNRDALMAPLTPGYGAYVHIFWNVGIGCQS